MRTKVQDIIKNLSQEGIELAQERDFDSILFDLQTLSIVSITRFTEKILYNKS